MYIFDKNVFHSMGFYYPSRFPTLWQKIDVLADNGTLRSVREVRKEIEANCQFPYIAEWVKNHHGIFLTPGEEEMEIVGNLFQDPQVRNLIKKNNILKGLPVADPFIIA